MKPLLPLAYLSLSMSIACSAASSGGNSSSASDPDAGAGARADSGSASSSSSGSSPVPPKLHDPAECSKLGECFKCCVDDFQGGAQFYRIAELQCVCVGTGSCADVCSSGECQLLSSANRTCDDCIRARLAATCDPQADKACAGDVTCATYAKCVSLCP